MYSTSFFIVQGKSPNDYAEFLVHDRDIKFQKIEAKNLKDLVKKIYDYLTLFNDNRFKFKITRSTYTIEMIAGEDRFPLNFIKDDTIKIEMYLSIFLRLMIESENINVLSVYCSVSK